MKLFSNFSYHENLFSYIERSDLSIKLKRPRENRLGDFHYNPKTKLHHISLNDDLNEEARFFVLTHEIAHFINFLNYKNLVLPHGKEWKMIFRFLLEESVSLYPKTWQKAIQNHANRPFANIMHDNQLANLIFPNSKKDIFQLFDLAEGNEFSLKSRKFKVLEKKRKRYLCEEIESNKKYWVHQNAFINRI